MEKTNIQTETRHAASGQNQFKISLASSGGFTGMFKGFSLYADGTVEHWLRYPSQKDSVLWTTTAEQDEIKSFQRRLQQSGILQETLQGTGNMTTMVGYEAPDSSYVWSWSGVGVPDNIPNVFKEWYQSVQEFCKSQKPNN